jgi:hypothetical protein
VVKKVVGRPFEKGKSGNPSGRPSDAALKELCRAETARNIKQLIKFRDGRSYPIMARIKAIELMLQRGYGNPPQAITGNDGAPLRIIIANADVNLG